MLPGGASGEKVVCHGVDGHPQSSVSSALHDFPEAEVLNFLEAGLPGEERTGEWLVSCWFMESSAWEYVNICQYHMSFGML